MSHLINEQEKTKRAGDAICSISPNEGKTISDVIGAMLGACEDGRIGAVGASMIAWLEAGE